MELREWLIILGLALVTLIVIDGVRRLQRQRRVPRLDQVSDRDERGPTGNDEDPEAAARAAEINWELPNGGARVVRPAEDRGVQSKPKLQRQEHPGPSRVLAEFRRHAEGPETSGSRPAGGGEREPSVARPAAEARETFRPVNREPEFRAQRDPERSAHASTSRDPAAEGAIAAQNEADERREPGLSSLDGLDEKAKETTAMQDTQPLAADPEDHDAYADEEHYRLVDLEGMGDSLKSGSRRVGSSMQRFGASLQKSLAERREHKRSEKVRREQERAEKAAREAARRQQAEDEKAVQEAERRRLEAEAVASADDDDPLFTPSRSQRQAPEEAPVEAAMDDVAPRDDVVRTHPVLERALRHDVNAEHARETLSQADEIIVISVMSRDEAGFSGTALLDLMLACGLRYGRDMGIFHRFETEDPESRLQFSMVNVVKPGTFPIEAMDDFRTQGITLLMPLPGASDTAAAFEAMVETAMVIVRHLGGELKDENQSVMTAQTVEFARQRVQEFERRNRLNRYQVN
ncbi:cell division protein ZipA [Halomonas rhizosphaerae]|uniref:Cell division protein ZipA n=1 Tax=Halomonas rhizosphaerae TaxID=3043296 RepID=A0ABT6UW90_9GAMM|nr:cell division protein ZipA [Halomonas rhizosphaerae]MDI5890232.1 cell division protein ZipA [Halomonas rhizosphaerae]